MLPLLSSFYAYCLPLSNHQFVAFDLTSISISSPFLRSAPTYPLCEFLVTCETLTRSY